MSEQAHANTIWARALMDALAGAGVEEVCLAPGSRSTPLVLAASRHPGLRLRVHLDERSASFFALGLGKATGWPAAVITTSGTAAANLLPAVVEASWSGTPLLLLTADRPPRLRGADANQAIDQIGLYGRYTRSFHDLAVPSLDADALGRLRGLASRAVADALGEPAGPVHLNVPFDKPLEPAEGVDRVEAELGAAGGEGDGVGVSRSGHEERHGGGATTRITRRASLPEEGELERLADLLSGARRSVLVAGPVPDPEAVGAWSVRLASLSGMPLVADPLSGARWRDHGDALVVGAYDLFLSSSEVREELVPDLVVRVGQSPTSRALQLWLEEHDSARQVVLDNGYRWKDHQMAARGYVRADPARTLEALVEGLRVREATWPAGSAWPTLWSRHEEAARRVLAESDDFGPGLEGAVLAEVAKSVRPGDGIFVSSSMPVRDLDAFGAPASRAEPVLARGNRGASGIDGIVSTALGVAAGTGRRVVAVVGDLAFYHDMNGLLATREEDVDVVFVLINNDGGGIFHMLPIAEHEPDFTPYFATPHGLDFEHAARLYDLPRRRVEPADFAEAWAETLDSPGTRIVEVGFDRTESHGRRKRLLEAMGRHEDDIENLQREEGSIE